MADDVRDQVHRLSDSWARAEREGSADQLEPLLHDEFVAVGPLGFVLDREQWLDRFRKGMFTYTSFEWKPEIVAIYDGAAVVVGSQRSRGTHDDDRIDAEVRVTQVAVPDGGAWRLASLHFSGSVEHAEPEAS